MVWGKEATFCPSERVLHDEGQGALDLGRDVEEGAGGGEGGVKGDEFLGAEIGGVFLEILAHVVAVVAQGLVERGEDHAAGGEFGGHGGAANELAVGVDEFGGVGKVGQVGDVLGGILGQSEAGKVKALEVGVAPSLVEARGQREGVEGLPTGAFVIEPPSGQVGALGEVGVETSLVEVGSGGEGRVGEGGGHAGGKVASNG